MKIMNLGVTIAMVLVFACKPETEGDQGSSVNGSSIAELKSQRAGAAPLYQELLPSQEGNEKVFRIGIYFSYDRDPFANPGAMLQQNDLSFAAYQKMREYFALTTERGGVFLRSAGGPKIVSEQPNRSVVYRGKGVAVAGGKESWTWEVSIGVGSIAEVTRAFGTAMANHQITILNGHFYSSQLESTPNTGMGPAFDTDMLKRRVYTPAMDAFNAAKAARNINLPYRIVVFNGCGSEAVENLVLERYGPGKVDIVGQRGVSNYRYFNLQLVKFINAIANGQKWVDTLQALTFIAPEQNNPMLPPQLKNVVPVLRSRY
jgi:hypothetical protein